ncbi:hypothetical protein D3C86_1296920 [compost metagenome]
MADLLDGDEVVAALELPLVQGLQTDHADLQECLSGQTVRVAIDGTALELDGVLEATRGQDETINCTSRCGRRTWDNIEIHRTAGVVT